MRLLRTHLRMRLAPRLFLFLVAGIGAGGIERHIGRRPRFELPVTSRPLIGDRHAQIARILPPRPMKENQRGRQIIRPQLQITRDRHELIQRSRRALALRGRNRVQVFRRILLRIKWMCRQRIGRERVELHFSYILSDNAVLRLGRELVRERNHPRPIGQLEVQPFEFISISHLSRARLRRLHARCRAGQRM